VAVIDIFRVADNFRADFVGGSVSAERQVALGYEVALGRIQDELGKVTRKMARAQAAGEEIKPSWLYEQNRLASLERATKAEIAKAGRRSLMAVDSAQMGAAERALDATKGQVAGQLGPRVGTSPAIGARFDSLPTGLVEEVVGRLSDGTPLTAAHFGTPDQVWADVQRELVKGAALGWNPNKIASRVQVPLNLSAARAKTLARTEILNAQREASRRIYELNDDIIGEWAWDSATDFRTCPVCWHMHGKRFEVRVRMATHPSCRCSMTPVTRTWEELGLGGFDGADRRRDFPIGDDLFRRLAPQDQLRVLGPAKKALYDTGQIGLRDLVAEGVHPRWGAYRRERSLKEIGFTPRQVRKLVTHDPSELAADYVPSAPTTDRDPRLVELDRKTAELARRFATGQIKENTYKQQLWKLNKARKGIEGGIPRPVPSLGPDHR
jgi:SPP1 gp7 family putative phage head morphogenesis protein